VQTIESQKLSGPGLVPFRYSKDSHAGYTGAQIAEIKNGETTVTGKPLVTDDGDGDITESTASPTPAPANGIPPSS
jgi:branched-chain amino acid transport system substrate-binding protein